MTAHTEEGGCACGHVRYRLTDRPLFVHACHCGACQRQTGAAFAVNALIESDRLELLHGELSDITVPTASGKGQLIARCPRCQVAAWSRYMAMPGPLARKILFVRVGTLDHPERMPPDIHIHTASMRDWFRLPSDALAMNAYYDMTKIWPPDRLARLAAVMKAEGR